MPRTAYKLLAIILVTNLAHGKPVDYRKNSPKAQTTYRAGFLWKEQPIALELVFLELSRIRNPAKMTDDDLCDLASVAIDACEIGDVKTAQSEAKKLQSMCQQALAEFDSQQQAALLGLTVALEVSRQCQDYPAMKSCLFTLYEHRSSTKSYEETTDVAIWELYLRSAFAISQRDMAIKVIRIKGASTKNEQLRLSSQLMLAWMLAERGLVLEAQPLLESLETEVKNLAAERQLAEYSLLLAGARARVARSVSDIPTTAKIVTKALTDHRTCSSLWARSHLVDLELIGLEIAPFLLGEGNRPLIMDASFLSQVDQVEVRTRSILPDPTLELRLNALRVKHYRAVRDRENLNRLSAKLSMHHDLDEGYLRPNFVKALLELGVVMSDQDQQIKTLELCSKVGKFTSLFDGAGAESCLAQIKTSQKKYSEADQHFNRARRAMIKCVGPFSLAAIMTSADWTACRKKSEAENWQAVYTEHLEAMKLAREQGVDAADFVNPTRTGLSGLSTKSDATAAATAWSLLEQACVHSLTQSDEVKSCRKFAQEKMMELAQKAITDE